MTAENQRQRRLASLRKRIAGPQDSYERCRVFPCANGTTADRGEGLNRLYCRKHIEFYRRHGSYVKRSYGAGELKPYRATALAWLRAHCDDSMVLAALVGIKRLYAASGAPVEAFRLSGRPPPERAQAMWAQLRKREIDPTQVVAAWIAVELQLLDDKQPDRHEEYREVQAAKLIHRMAGGSHKRWERVDSAGAVSLTELHTHPVSRGQVLRVLGRQLRAACGHLTAEHLPIPTTSPQRSSP